MAVGLAGASCARAPRPVVAPPLTAAQVLDRDVRGLVNGPGLDRVLWAVVIESLSTGESVVRINPRLPVVPASNMKVVTTAVAAERLGWDYTFETRLAATAPIDATTGTLAGDLVIVGTGDPSLNGRDNRGAQALASWAAELRGQGLRHVQGRIIGDDDAFDDEALGAGWAWDYLADAYAAPIGALQFNQNAVEVRLAPGRGAGAPVSVELRSPAADLVIDNRMTTAATGTPVAIEFHRLAGSATLRVTGTLPLGSAPVSRFVSVNNPTEYLARAVRHALVDAGIGVGGDAVDVDTLGEGERPAALQTLLVHRSPPLGELAKVLMKDSQNLYAETFLRAIGRQASDRGTAAAGREAIGEVLTSWGIDPGGYAIADGSGLSRYNFVNAEMLVAILRRMYQDARHRESWMATLPVAGRDGTLATRMIGTSAEGVVQAKTGTIARVRGLSGYVQAASGERLVFSIVANNFLVPTRAIDAAVDQVMDRLARFTR